METSSSAPSSQVSSPQVNPSSSRDQGLFPLADALGLFVNNSKWSDVVFLVGEKKEKISAHKFMLAARSKVFEAMFYGGFHQVRSQIIVKSYLGCSN
jgi:hypothetical protein